MIIIQITIKWREKDVSVPKIIKNIIKTLCYRDYNWIRIFYLQSSGNPNFYFQALGMNELGNNTKINNEKNKRKISWELQPHFFKIIQLDKQIEIKNDCYFLSFISEDVIELMDMNLSRIDFLHPIPLSILLELYWKSSLLTESYWRSLE
jgi:hypothetical protein